MTDAWQNVHALGMMSHYIDYFASLTSAINIFESIRLKALNTKPCIILLWLPFLSEVSSYCFVASIRIVGRIIGNQSKEGLAISGVV